MTESVAACAVLGRAWQGGARAGQMQNASVGPTGRVWSASSASGSSCCGGQEGEPGSVIRCMKVGGSFEAGC